MNGLRRYFVFDLCMTFKRLHWSADYVGHLLDALGGKDKRQ